MTKAVFYQSVGPELAFYDIDVENAALTKRGAITREECQETFGAEARRCNDYPAK